MLPKRVDDYSTVSREMHRVAEEIFYAHLKRVGLKRTAQRDIILRTFLETHDHLSTEELHHLVQGRDPHIGFTTVYRTLKLFADCGLASAVAFQDGVARYEHQLNRRNHHHMVCTEYGSFGRVLLARNREGRAGNRSQTSLRHHAAHVSDLQNCEECAKKIGDMCDRLRRQASRGGIV